MDETMKMQTLTLDEIRSRYSQRQPATKSPATAEPERESAFIEEADIEREEPTGQGVFDNLRPDPAREGSYFGDNLDPEGATGKKKEPDERPEEESGNSEKASRKYRLQARLFAKTFDTGAAMGFSAWSGADSGEFKAKEEDLNEIIEALALYLEETKGNIPAWLTLILLVVIVYAPIWRKASILKKEVERGQYHHTGTAKEAEATVVKPESSPDTEETEDPTVTQLPDLNETNEQAIKAGLDTFQTDEPCPEGLCTYHWYVVGEEVPAQMGNFLDRASSARWAGLKKAYVNRGIEWPV